MTFAPLFDAAGTGPWTMQERPWPAAYATAEAKGVVHRARRAQLGQIGDLRAVHLHGARAEIVNVFVFPPPERAAPTFALEFVRFGDRIVVAVIDLPWLIPGGTPAGWQARWRATWSDFPELLPASDAPAWFEDCRSGADLFTRPTGPTAAHALDLAAATAWQGWIEAVTAAEQLPPSGVLAHRTAQQGYRDHHRAHSPGRPFLDRTFGHDWSEAFLRDCLFAPA